MVYVEALFAGLPVLFTSGTAIDGYLGGVDVARTAAPRDVGGIAAAILELWRDAARLRANVVEAAPHLFATFDPAGTLERYRADIRAVLAGREDQE